MHDENFETCLERKNSRNYFDTKFTDIAFCIGNLHVKETISTNPIIIQSAKIYININISVKGQVFFQASQGDYFLIEYIICMKYGTTTM